MKFTISTIFRISAILATASAAPSPDPTYNLRVDSNNPAIKDALLVVKSESVTPSPNALGVWSSGEPRPTYTFRISPNYAVNEKLFGLEGTVGKTHSILYGSEAAMRLHDVPVGADPTPATGESLFTNTFMQWNSVNGTQIRFVQQYKDGIDLFTLTGAGAWRACKDDSEVDYQVIWFDGLSRLENYVKGCESIGLYLEEAKSAPKPTPSFITGVPAPTSTTGSSPFLAGVPAPTGTPSQKGCYTKTFHV